MSPQTRKLVNQPSWESAISLTSIKEISTNQLYMEIKRWYMCWYQQTLRNIICVKNFHGKGAMQP